MRLDEGVTKDLKRLLRLPFSIHGDSELLVVPFDPTCVEDFRVSDVPSLAIAAVDSDRVDVYTKVLKQGVITQASKYQQFIRKPINYKSQARNPFENENSYLPDSGYEDIWTTVKPMANEIKSKLFWFQVRTGLL